MNMTDLWKTPGQGQRRWGADIRTVGRRLHSDRYKAVVVRAVKKQDSLF